MKNDNNIPHGDILAAKLRRMQRPALPEGLEDKIMLRLQASAARAGRNSIFRHIAAWIAAVAGASGVIFAVLYFAGITGAEISALFYPIGNLFINIGESIASVLSKWPPVHTVTSAILLIGLLYVSLNELLSSRAHRKAMN